MGEAETLSEASAVPDARCEELTERVAVREGEADVERVADDKTETLGDTLVESVVLDAREADGAELADATLADTVGDDAKLLVGKPLERADGVVTGDGMTERKAVADTTAEAELDASHEGDADSDIVGHADAAVDAEGDSE